MTAKKTLSPRALISAALLSLIVPCAAHVCALPKSSACADTAECAAEASFTEVSLSGTDIDTVYLGGDAIGVKFYTGCVMVVGISDVRSGRKQTSPATKAGLCAGDMITEVNGTPTDTVEKMEEIITKSGGRTLEVSFLRDGKKLSASLTPVKNEDGEYKAGMWIRDSSAGIGTVSFVTRDGVFASLGHGITDIDTGSLMPLSKGSCVKTDINFAVKGRPNVPGELKGTFSNVRTGTLISNTESGLFGKFGKGFEEGRELIGVGKKSEVKTGRAQIVSTVDESGPKRYDIEIVQISHGSEKSKNFIVKICDERLKEATGGIVQGMSGSPVIQNGKLVGAITHVMVSDPTRGYGIFIENMLDKAPKQS